MQSSFSSWVPLVPIQIVIPGGEIPRWFSEQNVGNSIRVDSSPVMRNQNWIGLACCFTFVTHKDPTNLNDPIYSLFYWLKHERDSYEIPIHFRKDLVTVEFDHMVLLYFTRERLINSNQLVEFVSIDTHPQELHVEVKKCGYKWVYEEDLDQLIHSMEHNGNSSVLEGNLLTNESPDELNHGKAA